MIWLVLMKGDKSLLPPCVGGKKLLKHCVAKVVHELAHPLVAGVLGAREACAALAVDEAHDDALRQGKRVAIGAEMQLIFRASSLNYNLSRFRRLDCQPTVVTTLVLYLLHASAVREHFQRVSSGRVSRIIISHDVGR